MTDIELSELRSRVGEDGLVLLDVRGPHEFSGAIVAPCDPRGGHIPGAVNVDVSTLAQADLETVRTLVDAPAGTEVVAYCHSGSRSAFAVQVLAAAGYDARNYVGSWHEWSRDPALPAETGGPH